MPSATRNLFEKRGRRPQPIHGQTDAVLSGHHLKKDCFFCFLLHDINKKVLTRRRQKGWWILDKIFS